MLGGYAVLAAFAWIHAGGAPLVPPASIGLDAAPIEDAELWAWSGAWLVFGAALMAGGIRAGSKALRLAAIAMIGLTAAKVFMVDMAGLVGLWRVLSFLGLGLTLIGLGAVYRRLSSRRCPARGIACIPAAIVTNIRDSRSERPHERRPEPRDPDRGKPLHPAERDRRRRHTTNASFWRILFCPAGPGHVLYLKSELTDNRLRIYSDNIAMARWLQSTVQGMLNAETADPTIPVIDAEFSRSGDPRYFWTERLVSRDEEIALTWYDIGDPLLIHTQPNAEPGASVRRVHRAGAGTRRAAVAQRGRGGGQAVAAGT